MPRPIPGLGETWDEIEMNTRKLLIAAAGLAVTLSGASMASAQDNFASSHPRRAEVNSRLERQNERIDQRLESGAIGPAKAHRLHRAEFRMRMHEQRFAMHHHGRISERMQARLNRQENRVSHRIG